MLLSTIINKSRDSFFRTYNKNRKRSQGLNFSLTS